MADPYQFDPSKLYESDGFNHQNPFNVGIGDFWANKDKWRDMNTGQLLTRDQISNINAMNKNGVDMNFAGNSQDPHSAEMQKYYDAMKTYTYMGDDGNKYMVGGNYYRGGPTDQETAASSKYDFAFGGAVDGAGRTPGEMAYSVAEYRPDWDGDMGAYNGRGFDFFDKNGGYVGGNVPGTLGDKAWDRWQLAVLASMALAGAGAYMAPASAGAAGGTTTATLGEGALAASGNFGVNAGTAGAAGANAAAAGAGGVGAAGATGGNGAFIGEGVQSGVPAWDGAAGGAAGGYGTTPLTGVGASNPYAGASSGLSSAGGSAGSSGSGIMGQLNSSAMNIPYIGDVSWMDLAKLGVSLAGAYGGSKGNEQSTSSTKELPEWLQGPVTGQGGLVPSSFWLMNQQLNQPGLVKSRKHNKRGLL